MKEKSWLEIAIETLKSIRDYSTDRESARAASEALKLILKPESGGK